MNIMIVFYNTRKLSYITNLLKRDNSMAERNYKIIDLATTYIDNDAEIEDGVIIYPNNTIIGKTKICKNVILHPNNIITDSTIGEGSSVIFSVITGSTVGAFAKIGPFTHLREGCAIGDNCKAGSFVEIKKSEIGSETKVPHLSYVGDCKVGEKCNIGCGVVFANYDGKNKHKSTVGDNCFIGSNSNIIAPVEIGDNCYIAAATTVTKSIPRSSFVIGRVKQQENDKLKNKYIGSGR